MQPELIETLLVAADGGIPLLQRHLRRLQASAQALDYRCDALAVEADILAAAGRLAAPGPHRLRLLLDPAGQRTIQAAPLPPLAPQQYIMLGPDTLDASQPLLRYKTTYRPWYEQAAQWLAAQPQVFDLVYMNGRGELCEGSRSNLYLKLDGRWYTPPLSCGCLPGVQRAELLDHGQAHERVLPVGLLREAEGIRLSNALRGWFDVALRD